MMGDSACLVQMQQPFSYVSGIPNDANEVNPIHALGQSISFGRFMTEPLAWEKWSSFSSHNRYVEEAERYARPGSVAQKKAFFEAHYKELAARKAAAAALEQAQAASNNAPEPECSPRDEDLYPQTKISDEEQMVKVVQSGSVLEANELNSNAEMDQYEDSKVGVSGADPVAENQVLLEDPEKIEPVMELKGPSSVAKPVVKVTDFNGDLYPNGDKEVTGTPSIEKPLLKDSKLNQESSVSKNKKKLVFSNLRTSLHSRASKTPSSPAATKPVASLWPRREPDVTPVSKKAPMDYSENTRSTPKSTHKSMSFTPAREFNKLTSTVMRKIENSRFGAGSSKASKDKDCCTPLRTPILASVNKSDKHPLATPRSENRRAKASLDPASESKTIGSRWRFLPTDCSKFLSASRNKAQSPSIAFTLRTEERAAKRKEKLEEKFNAKVTEKVQLQTKIKEKAETELKRLRQNLCFKARPLPDFYKDRSTTSNQTKKVPQHPQSPKLGKKLNPGTSHGIATLPLQKPTVKSSGSKQVFAKNERVPTSILTARFRMPTHENTSPNIQSHG